MSKWRKKPVVIEAVRVVENGFSESVEWLLDKVAKGVITQCMENVWEIHTLEGVMKAKLGDWIIKGVHGEVYPCNEEIFNKTYERVNE